MAVIPRKIIFMVFLFACFIQSATYSQDVTLLPPQKEGGMPLMEALNNRKSTRDFGSQAISQQVLSDLLWAAYGYNRPQEKKRTAPSALNIQNMGIYVALADGLYLYNAEDHSLELILQEDIRAETGTQAYVKNAPLNLVYVADLSMMSNAGDKGEFYSIAHAGFISQNVYLFCASSGLVTVVRDWIDRDALKVTMKLKEDQEIILAQSVGYPIGSSQHSMEGDEKKIDENYSLFHNFPNPFNAETQIHYSLSNEAHVRITVCDIKGDVIKAILNDKQTSGEYLLKWDGTDDAGKRMASGVYFYQIELDYGENRLIEAQKMLMLK